MSENSPSAGSFLVGVCFTLNYIIGTGFLTLPWAFNETGAIIGFVVLAILSLFSIMVVIFVLEALARAEAWENGITTSMKSYNGKKSTYSVIPETSQHLDTNYKPMKQGSHFEIETNEGNHLLRNEVDRLLVKTTVYEIPELADLYLGKYGKISYTFFVSIYLFSALWAYTTVFGLAFSTHVYIGPYSYQIYIVIFSLFVVPMSLMDLKEQIAVQVFLSACRIFMLGIMVSTILYAKYTSTALFGDYIPDSTPPKFKMSNFNGIYLLLPIAAYANIFHHSIPSLCQLVSDKSTLNSVFFTALIVATISYTTLGVIVSEYFGNLTAISSNLNWSDFHSVNGSTITEARIAYMLATFVVLFPAFDVASAFPLNAITLANNLMSYYDGPETRQNEDSRYYKTIFRVATVLPAIICAFFFSNLGEITHIAGLAGFAIGFIYPALLAYYSKIKLQEKGIPYETAYSYPGVSTASNILTVMVGFGLLFFVGYCLIAIGPVG